MRTIPHQSLLQIITFILFISNVQFTCTYASMNDEHEIEKIFKTHGKVNVVNFIFKRRNGKITIQKNKSFLNITGRPDIAFITAKTIIQDLKILKVDISNLKTELDIHIKNESKKEQEELNNLASMDNDKNTLLRTKLKRQMQIAQSKYDKTDSVSEQKRLKRELSRLKKAYKKAENNDKKTKKRRSGSYCDTIKSKLQKLTDPDYRHQVFFCNERDYRLENPELCDQSRYSRQYTFKEHKDEIRKLRMEESKNCGS